MPTGLDLQPDRDVFKRHATPRAQRSDRQPPCGVIVEGVRCTRVGSSLLNDCHHEPTRWYPVCSFQISVRIAQISPLFESVPPAVYGGTERVVSYLTEEL